jgi:hypothetical protein
MSLMAGEPRTAAVRVLGDHGEVSFGNEYAGHTVEIKELEPGIWIVKVGEPVPENERWLLDPKVQADLDEAIAWAERTPPQTTDLKDFEERILGGFPDDSGSPRSE